MEYQEEFVNVEGGFVKKEAVEVLKEAEASAEERNSSRTFIERMTGKNKATPLDILRSYQPTPDEIKKAEEVMTSSEKAMSRVREEYHKDRNEEGKEIPDNFKFNRRTRWNPSNKEEIEYIDISGEFKGHNFLLSIIRSVTQRPGIWSPYEVRDISTEGGVDGKPLSREEASLLWKKFTPITMSALREQEETSSTGKRVIELEKAEVRRKEFESTREGIEGILKDFDV